MRASPTLIYCGAGNRRWHEIAAQYGMEYGAQLPGTVYHPVYFADQDWRKPDRARYMAALAQHRPALATVLDWERADQEIEVMDWSEEAAQYVQEAVIVIPKVAGTIRRLPRQISGKQVRLGYSVPTRYAGTKVGIDEFQGWPVHLLGGSPKTCWALAERLDVKSADGNYLKKLANRCVYATPDNSGRGVVSGLLPTGAHYLAFELSIIYWMNGWRGVAPHCTAMEQRALLRARFGDRIQGEDQQALW